MKKLLLPLALMATMLFSCSHEHSHEHTDEAGLEVLAYTLYTDKTELFVEFKPLVVGTESRFAAHFTALGDNFKAFTEGTITLTVNVDGKPVSVTATEPQVPGIFRLRLTPKTAGIARLTFDIKTKSFSDQIVIDSVKVYADEKAALADQPEEAGGGNDITYLKEQAWKVEFANEAIRKMPLSNVIKTSGQILSAPGDEMVITAKANGVIVFTGNKAIIGSQVSAGEHLFTVTAGDLAEGNIDASYKETKAKYETAKAEYERASELVKDKIVSERDFLQAKLAFENAQTAFNAISKNYSKAGQAIVSPMGGYIKNILVSEGQYVTAGMPIAAVSKNKKLILQANVSQRYFERLSSISSANFRSTENGKVFSTEQLGGRVISYGRSTSANTPFLPVTFEIDNKGELIPGSTVEVYLKSTPLPAALSVPVTALIEEQGSFFVYVQTEGESFQKREVKLGANDGLRVEVLSGIAEGERVVTKGAYQIKLSTASGTLPAHGHEH